MKISAARQLWSGTRRGTPATGPRWRGRQHWLDASPQLIGQQSVHETGPGRSIPAPARIAQAALQAVPECPLSKYRWRLACPPVQFRWLTGGSWSLRSMRVADVAVQQLELLAGHEDGGRCAGRSPWSSPSRRRRSGLPRLPRRRSEASVGSPGPGLPGPGARSGQAMAASAWQVLVSRGGQPGAHRLGGECACRRSGEVRWPHVVGWAERHSGGRAPFLVG